MRGGRAKILAQFILNWRHRQSLRRVFLLTPLQSGRLSLLGCKVHAGGEITREFLLERRWCAYAQHVEVCFGTVGGTRWFGRECRRAIQKRKPGDGAEYSARQPTRHGVPANRTDGYHDNVPPAGSRRAGDLGQNSSLWEGGARRRE